MDTAHHDTTARPMLPARRVAVLSQLPEETDIRLRWDVDTGWASLATAQPSGKPRFLGFAQFIAAATEHSMRVAEVVGALRRAGFTVLADVAEVDRLRETWIRYRRPAPSALEPAEAPGAPVAASAGR
jgi:hypothetical protein